MAEDCRQQAKDAPESQIARCVRTVCRMPIDFKTRSNVSMIGLIEESGYSALADDISELILEEYLRRHPELVGVWVHYSEDRRRWPAFGISGPNTVEGLEKNWRVFFWDKNPSKQWQRTFPDQFTAGAFFIKCEAEYLVSISGIPKPDKNRASVP